MTKLSTAVLAVTASLALGAMTVSASAGHNNGGGNKEHSNGGGGGGNGGSNMHHDGHGHGYGRWHGGLWIPYYGGYDGDEPRCWWRHGHRIAALKT